MEWLFWVSFLLLLQTYFLYPLSVWLLNRVVPSTLKEVTPGAHFEPSVSLVVAAYNEEQCIGRKIENSLALDYPTDRLEVLVGSDGSTDGTDALVAACSDARVSLRPGPRAGKTSVLNRCIAGARGEIVVLTDANTEIEPSALHALVRHFQTPQIGAVCGKLILHHPAKRNDDESAYWRYESFIKQLEGRRGAVLGANGGLYAIRRCLFESLPPATIVDDFVIPMRMLLNGHRVVYEPSARAYEETAANHAQEFSRRVRIAAGNFQSLRWLKGLLSPRHGFVAYAFISHKLLRWVAPLLLLLALVSNALLALRGGSLYLTAFFLQASFYALAWAGSLSVLPPKIRRLPELAFYFVSMNVALARGFSKFLMNSQSAAWDRTPRAP